VARRVGSEFKPQYHKKKKKKRKKENLLLRTSQELARANEWLQLKREAM
jgi:hypothetical protein